MLVFTLLTIILFIFPVPNEEVVGGTWIKATQTSLVIKIPASVVKSAQEEYPDVIVL